MVAQFTSPNTAPFDMCIAYSQMPPAAARSARPARPAVPREREVRTLIAEGRSNASIAGRLPVTAATVGKHVGNILTKLGLLPSDDANRRVLAVLTYLRATP